MTLFGRTLDGQEIASLVSLLLVLVLWISVWRGDRRQSQWFSDWNAARKARRDAEITTEDGGSSAGPNQPRGPWG